MGLLNSIKDHFTNAEFSVAPNKKVKTICADFKKHLVARSLFTKVLNSQTLK